MLRVKDIPPEELPEVVRVAGELYDREHAENRERKATVDAAAEMGIPAEYLERAAAEVHARRVERIRQKRRRRNGILATLAAAVAVGGVWQVTRPAPPPAPTAYTIFAPVQWQLDKNRESEATVAYENGAATIRVQRFANGPNGTYFVNLNTQDVPRTLAGYRTVRFRVRGEGLPQIRLYLENGQERWRSPALPVSGQWQEHQLPLKWFDYQTRRPSDPPLRWRNSAYRPPKEIQRLSFKVGDYVNERGARGEVTIDDLRFE